MVLPPRCELLEKGSDATLLHEMIGFAAQRLVELETEALCGTGHGERSEERTNLRTGYRDRDWHTREAQSNCGSRSCVRAAISLVFSSRAGWRRRR
jgi:Transposase, Mutator family